MAGNSNWNMDDLDGGLSTDLFNLSGLGNDMSSEAYKMSDVLNLPIFKDNVSMFDELQDVSTKHSIHDKNVSNHDVKEEEQIMSCSHANKTTKDSHLQRNFEFYHVLAAPTAPGKKMGEDTLTYLNQGQSYLINLKGFCDCLDFDNTLIKSKVKLTFYERKLQILEVEKFEEWKNNRPLERLLEIDCPMSSGIHNIVSEANQSNSYAFEWNPSNETKLYIIINCVSSEFTKGKSGGESGVPLQLQIETQIPETSSNSSAIHFCSCQVKVFKSKGADRKHKNELQKLENKPHDEIGQYQGSYDFTVLTEKSVVNEVEDEPWHQLTPKQGLSPRQVASATPVTSPASTSYLSNQSQETNSHDVPTNMETELTSKSSVKETRAWLQENRFSHYLTIFANYTGSDLLRLTRQDMIQLLGPADGIRLHNTLQIRVTRPLLTIYVCLESTQQDSGMKEYLAMYLEAFDINHFKKKLAKKCCISDNQIVAIYRQGPTGIYILIDEEMIRNLQDESQFVVHLIKERDSDTYRIILK